MWAMPTSSHSGHTQVPSHNCPWQTNQKKKRCMTNILESAVMVLQNILQQFCMLQNTVLFQIVQHGLCPMTAALKFDIGRGQHDLWHSLILALLNFGMLILAISSALQSPT